MDVSTFGPPVLKAIQTSIGTSLSELNKINPKNSELTTLITDYTTLNNKITTDISGIANYTATTFPITLNDINNQLAILDTRRVTYLAPLTSVKTVSVGSIVSDTWSEIKTNIVGITTVLGMMFGCIVATHWSITSDMKIDKNMFYFLFYAVFGALLFPFPVLYGVINPPMWRAPLIPLFKKDATSSAFISYPGINLFTYIAPTPEDLPIGRNVLRTMCIIVSGLMGLTLYFKIKR